MLYAILVGLLIICFIGWLTRYISCAALLWYLQKNDCALPTPKDMKAGCEWAVRHTILDLFQKKNKN